MTKQPRDSQRSRLYAAEDEARRPFWEAQALARPMTVKEQWEWIERWDRDAPGYSGRLDWPEGLAAFHQMMNNPHRPEDVDDFLKRIQCSRWWDAQGYRYVWRDEKYRGHGWSHGSPKTGRIQIATGHMNRWVVLHEVAHAVQPLHTPWHGREFCAIYLKLVERWIGKDEARALRAAMVKHRVKHRAYSPRPNARRIAA